MSRITFCLERESICRIVKKAELEYQATGWANEHGEPVWEQVFGMTLLSTIKRDPQLEQLYY